MLSRRGFGALLGLALVETVLLGDALAGPVRDEGARWLREVDARCRELRGAALEQHEWQELLEALFARVELPSLLGAIDFERLTAKLALPDRGVTTRDVRLPAIEGLPSKPSYVARVFALGRGRAIVPHGHRNMVSAHLILDGKLHVRHFARVEDRPDVIVIRPTIDRVSGAGEATTISSERDNVHWMIAESERAFTLDVIVAGLGGETEVDLIDPDADRAREGGLIRARRIGLDEALRRYGKRG